MGDAVGIQQGLRRDIQVQDSFLKTLCPQSGKPPRSPRYVKQSLKEQCMMTSEMLVKGRGAIVQKVKASTVTDQRTFS